LSTGGLASQESMKANRRFPLMTCGGRPSPGRSALASLTAKCRP
jgi:hypothetical protein